MRLRLGPPSALAPRRLVCRVEGHVASLPTRKAGLIGPVSREAAGLGDILGDNLGPPTPVVGGDGSGAAMVCLRGHRVSSTM